MTSYTVPDGPKMLRESLCVAQTQIGQSDDPRKAEHIARLGRLIEECDRHRPLGPDGKHGDRHTPTCGCGDPVVTDLERAQEWLYRNVAAPFPPGTLGAGTHETRAKNLAALLAEVRADQDARWRAQWEGRWAAPGAES